MKLFKVKKLLGLPVLVPAFLAGGDDTGAPAPGGNSFSAHFPTVVAEVDQVHTIGPEGLQLTVPAGWAVVTLVEGTCQMVASPSSLSTVILTVSDREGRDTGYAELEEDNRKKYKKYQAEEAEEATLNGMEYVFQNATGVQTTNGPTLLKDGYICAREPVLFSIAIAASVAETESSLVDNILKSMQPVTTPSGPGGSAVSPAEPATGALPPGWKIVEHQNFGVSVAMPGGPELKGDTYTASSGGVDYSVAFIAKNDWNGVGRKEALQAFDGQAFGNVVNGKVCNRRYTTFQGRHGYKLTVRMWIGWVMQAQMVATDAGLVVIEARAKTEVELLDPEVEAFFKSMKLAENGASAS